jgi:malate synthase
MEINENLSPEEQQLKEKDRKRVDAFFQRIFEDIGIVSPDVPFGKDDVVDSFFENKNINFKN